MARLSYDALLLLAKLPAQMEMRVTEIAIHVFDGYNPETPTAPNKVAMARAMRAASAVVALGHAQAKPNRRKIDSIRLVDKTNGSTQAQFLMNLMVRGGADRRKGDRRAEPRADGVDPRQNDRRENTGVVMRPPRRIIRGVVSQPPKKPSPFDILDRIPPKNKA